MTSNTRTKRECSKSFHKTVTEDVVMSLTIMNHTNRTGVIFVLYGLEKRYAVAITQFNPGIFHALMRVISICDISIC